MVGIGHIAQGVYSILTAKSTVNGLGFVPMKSNFGNAFDLAYIPVNQIKTDEKNFQNRTDKYSEKSVNAIIKAVKNNSFNWFAFDPVLLWQNPDGDLFVLSGHSRTEAFRRLSQENPDLVIDGLNFSKIPAKIFKGDFVNAKNLALNSNALSTPETLLERADFYRKQRQQLSKRQDIAKLREKALRENQGAVIWDLSFLPSDGLTVDSLKRFKMQEDSEGAFENFIRAINIAQWIGKAFQIYPGLSKQHDNELFKFLVNNYGTKSGQYNSFTKLNDRLSVLYPRNVKNDKKINAKGEYTTPFGLIIYEKTDNEIAELDNLKKESDKAKRELSTKIKDLRGRTDDKEKIFEIVTPYFNSYINNLFQYWQGLDREKRRYEDKNQTALFGLGALGAAKQLEFLFPEVAANKELIATDKGVQYSIPFSNVAKQLSFDFFNQSKSGNELITKIVDKVVELENKVEALSDERDYGLLPGWIESLNILQNSGLIPVSDIISIIEKNPAQIFLTAGTDGIKKLKFKEKDWGTYYFNVVDDSGNPIPSEVAIPFTLSDIKRLNTELKSWFIEPEKSKPANKIFNFAEFMKKENLSDSDNVYNKYGLQYPVTFYQLIYDAGNIKDYVLTYNSQDPYYNEAYLYSFADMGNGYNLADIQNASKEEYKKAKILNQAAKEARKGKIKSEIVKEDIFLKIINPLVDKVKTDKKYLSYYYLIDKIKNDILFYLTKFESVYSPEYYDALNNIATFIFKNYEKGLKKNPEKLALAQTASALHSKLNLKAVDGLGKPKITLEFDDNTQLLNFKNNIAKNADSDLFFDKGEFKPSLKGFSVTNQPASIFNCPTSQLNFKGFKPTYKRLKSYDHLIEPATGNKTLVGYGFEKATLDELNNACRYYYQVQKLAEYLKGDNYLQSAFNLWHWLHENIKYNFDKEGEEEIRVPARTWADRESGVDCDCLAVFTACVLYCMGYEPKFEIVGFDDSETYSHIFVNLYGSAIDRVLPVFLKRPPLITITKIMDIPVFQLNGGADIAAAAELSGIYESTLRKINAHKGSAEDSVNEKKMRVLIQLQGSDDNAYKFGSLIMPFVSVIADDGAFYFNNEYAANLIEKADRQIYNLRQSGADESEYAEVLSNLAKELKTLSVEVAKTGEKTSVTVTFNNSANEAVKVSGELTKKELLTVNPVYIEMREALQKIIAVNLFGIATKFAIGLMTESQAASLGVDSEKWQEAVTAVSKLKTFWKMISGSETALIESIINGAEKVPLTENINLDSQIVETAQNDAVLSGCRRRGLRGVEDSLTVEEALNRLGVTLDKILAWCESVNLPSALPESAMQNTEPAETVIEDTDIDLLQEAAKMPVTYVNATPAEDDSKMLLYSVVGSLLAVSAISAFSGKKKKSKRR